MPRILVNHREQPSNLVQHHWGDTLERLDQRFAGLGQVLTAVRFDGVDQPSFRDQGRAFDTLDGIRAIDIDAASPDDLLAATFSEARTAAATLAAAAGHIAAAFRGVDIGDARRELGELAQGLATLVAIAQTLSQATRVSLEAVECSGASGLAMIDQLTACADTLIGAQQRDDWVTVADVIEYDLAPALREWPPLFDALQAGMSSPSAA